MKKSGFTLVEMLVVIGIIAVLAAASMVGYSKVVKSARKAKNQELVSNAATALTHILNKEGVWPDELTKDGGNGQLIRADDARCGRIKTEGDLLGNVGLDGLQLSRGKKAQALHAVGNAAAIELFKSLFVFFVEADDQ